MPDESLSPTLMEKGGYLGTTPRSFPQAWRAAATLLELSLSHLSRASDAVWRLRTSWAMLERRQAVQPYCCTAAERTCSPSSAASDPGQP
jgi:hypothetical protein